MDSPRRGAATDGVRHRLDSFDVLAYGSGATEPALRVVLKQSACVHALVLAAASPPADRDLAASVVLDFLADPRAFLVNRQRRLLYS